MGCAHVLARLCVSLFAGPLPGVSPLLFPPRSSSPARKRKKKKRSKHLDEGTQKFQLRDMVEITGHPKPELNGVCGLLEYWVKGKKMWIVRVAGNVLKQTLKIKPSYLKKVTAEEAKEAMEKIKESKEKQKALNELIKSKMKTLSTQRLSKLAEEEKKKQVNDVVNRANESINKAMLKAKREAAQKEAQIQAAKRKQKLVFSNEVTTNGNKVDMSAGIVMKPPNPHPTLIVLKQPQPQQPQQHIVNTQPTSPIVRQPQPMAPGQMYAQPGFPGFPVFQPMVYPAMAPMRPFVPPAPAMVVPPPGTATGSRPMVPHAPSQPKLAKPPIKPLEANLDEENMDQGADSDDDAPAAQPAKPMPGQPGGAPPMMPPPMMQAPHMMAGMPGMPHPMMMQFGMPGPPPMMAMQPGQMMVPGPHGHPGVPGGAPPPSQARKRKSRFDTPANQVGSPPQEQKAVVKAPLLSADLRKKMTFGFKATGGKTKKTPKIIGFPKEAKPPSDDENVDVDALLKPTDQTPQSMINTSTTAGDPPPPPPVAPATDGPTQPPPSFEPQPLPVPPAASAIMDRITQINAEIKKRESRQEERKNRGSSRSRSRSRSRSYTTSSSRSRSRSRRRRRRRRRRSSSSSSSSY